MMVIMTWHRRAGEPFVVKKAVCLHEEDAGLLWKHVEYRNGQNEVRRSRRLVISMVRRRSGAFVLTLLLHGHVRHCSPVRNATLGGITP